MCRYCKMPAKQIALTFMGWRPLCHWHWLRFAKSLCGLRVLFSLT